MSDYCPRCGNGKSPTANLCGGCEAIAGSSLAPATGSAADAYNEGWRDGLTAAANIFDKWYRNNCITAGATNAIELASRLFKESNLTHDDPSALEKVFGTITTPARSLADAHEPSSAEATKQ